MFNNLVDSVGFWKAVERGCGIYDMYILTTLKIEAFELNDMEEKKRRFNRIVTHTPKLTLIHTYTIYIVSSLLYEFIRM